MKPNRIILILIVLFAALSQAQSLREKVNKGNTRFSEGAFPAALENYNAALEEDPNNKQIIFNKADALYKMEKYEEALKAYQSVTSSKDNLLASHAYFNMANTLFKTEKLKESIASYKKALELNPSDRDAKYNMELARAKLKEKSQQQEQNKDEKEEQIEPSENAKRIKSRAEAMAVQGRFAEALSLMNRSLKSEPTLAAFKQFTQRLSVVAEIDEAN